LQPQQTDRTDRRLPKMHVDPVETHLPEFKEDMLVVERTESARHQGSRRGRSRPRDLLTHTSGLPCYPPGLGDLEVKLLHFQRRCWQSRR
jgi:CubicO group peptidase (beta-lactamase class C family)